MSQPTAAVIGAGVSGLVAAKELLTAGFSVTVYERGSRIGGIWAYSEDPQTPSVMRQTVLNLSTAQMTFSDFPFPKDHPNYASHTAYEDYLESYAQHFDLTRHIILNAPVIAVSHIENGRWVVSSRRGSESQTATYDRLIVAVGQNQVPFFPNTPGKAEFRGKVMHSINYKSHEAFNGKRVLVIGVANSGADVAVDLSGNATRVLLSGRRGIWLLPRLLPFGKPLDHLLTRKTLSYPSWLTDMFMRFISSFMFGRLAKYGLASSIRPTTINPTVNDYLGERLATGRVIAKPDIARLYENEVEFVDGTRETIDAIIFCTGFQRVFPFLPSLAMTGQATRGSPTMSLYKRIIPVEFPTLALVGHIHGLAHSAVAELQARWVARLFSGALTLPTEAHMRREIDDHAAWAMENTHGRISTCEVPAFPYMESLAKDIGCGVNTASLWWSRPGLRKLVIGGTFTPHQYRLFGPGKDMDMAESAIYNVCGVCKNRRWEWLHRLW
ncbi:hypothetical protein HDU87_004441 [Geranomyces variabilis]|uniref:Flavin-containing monooxygenase 1 n=1 Tax=Geranomyces variabilis TaxID=109894 RepID=A0AAD5TID7_9FUNG|nr:hypothetical protein HDU87_004441 [Geranomyces variabilis]